MWINPSKFKRSFKDYSYTELLELIRRNELKDLDNASKADIYVQYSLLLYRERNDLTYNALAKEQPFFLFSKLTGLDKVFREYLNDIEKECYLGATKYFNEKDIKKLNEFIDEFLKFQAHICLFFAVNYASNHEKNAQTFLSDLIDSSHLKTLHSLDDNSILREHFIRAYVSAIFAKLLYLVETSNISKLYYESSIYFGGAFTGTLEIIGIEPVKSKHRKNLAPNQISELRLKPKIKLLAHRIWKEDIERQLLPTHVANMIIQLWAKKDNGDNIRSSVRLMEWFDEDISVIPTDIKAMSRNKTFRKSKKDKIKRQLEEARVKLLVKPYADQLMKELKNGLYE